MTAEPTPVGLTVEDLAAIKARAGMLRSGLRAMVSDDRRWTLVVDPDGSLVAQCVDDDEADAIAHSRVDVDRLHAEVLRLRAELDRYRDIAAFLHAPPTTPARTDTREDVEARAAGYRPVGWAAVWEEGQELRASAICRETTARIMAEQTPGRRAREVFVREPAPTPVRSYHDHVSPCPIRHGGDRCKCPDVEAQYQAFKREEREWEDHQDRIAEDQARGEGDEG